jgi:hypothetical protein
VKKPNRKPFGGHIKALCEMQSPALRVASHPRHPSLMTLFLYAADNKAQHNHQRKKRLQVCRLTANGTLFLQQKGEIAK